MAEHILIALIIAFWIGFAVGRRDGLNEREHQSSSRGRRATEGLKEAHNGNIGNALSLIESSAPQAPVGVVLPLRHRLDRAPHIDHWSRRA